MYAADATWLWPALEAIAPSPAGERYLTDVIAAAVAHPAGAETYALRDAVEAQQVNTRVELARAERLLRDRIRHRLMLDGVTMADPPTTYVDAGGAHEYRLFYFDEPWRTHDGSLRWLAAHGARGAVVAEGRYGVRLGQTWHDAAADLRACISAAAAADPFLREHPPDLALTGGKFSSARVPADDPLPVSLAAAGARR